MNDILEAKLREMNARQAKMISAYRSELADYEKTVARLRSPEGIADAVWTLAHAPDGLEEEHEVSDAMSHISTAATDYWGNH